VRGRPFNFPFVIDESPMKSADDASEGAASSRPDALTGSPPRPTRRRRRWFARLAFYAIAAPAFVWAALAAYAKLTRLPDLDNDLSVLLPRDSTLLYAELPSPADLLPAIEGTHFFNAFTGRDDAGHYTDLDPLPGDDERSLRKAREQVSMFRMMATMMPRFFDAGVVYAVVRWPGDDEAANYFLTRSEPSAMKQLMPMFGMLAPGMKTENRVFNDVPYTLMLKYDDGDEDGGGVGELEDAFQFVQLGDVFAFVWGSSDPTHSERLIRAWYADNRRESHYAAVVTARERIEKQRPAREGDREWFFATLRGREFAGAALDVAQGHLARSDENDALDWIGYAKWAGRLGDASLIARSRGALRALVAAGEPVDESTTPPDGASATPSAVRDFEIAMVFRPPVALSTRGAESFDMVFDPGSRLSPEPPRTGLEIEVHSATAFSWFASLFIPGGPTHDESEAFVAGQIRELRRQLDAPLPDVPLRLRSRGPVAPPRLDLFALEPAQRGTESAREAARAIFARAGSSLGANAWGFRWPDGEPIANLRTALLDDPSREAGDVPRFRPEGSLLVGADLILTLFMSVGHLAPDDARSLLQALTSDFGEARTRRMALSFLTFLRDAPAWSLTAARVPRGDVFALLTSEQPSR
jgi:hypothetical protein